MASFASWFVTCMYWSRDSCWLGDKLSLASEGSAMAKGLGAYGKPVCIADVSGTLRGLSDYAKLAALVSSAGSARRGRVNGSKGTGNLAQSTTSSIAL